MEIEIGYGLESLSLNNMNGASPHRNFSRVIAAWQRWVIACLLVVLPLCGGASAVAALMGARHFHTGTSTAPVVAADVSGRKSLVVQPLRRPVFVHAAPSASDHRHDDLQRHHHDVSDSSAISVELSASVEAARVDLESSAAKAGISLSAWCCLLGEAWLGVGGSAPSPWGESPRWSSKTVETRALRRPPKA